jgi:hypothetical protein
VEKDGLKSDTKRARCVFSHTSEEVVAQVPHPIPNSGKGRGKNFCFGFAVEAIKVPPLVGTIRRHILREERNIYKSAREC